MSRTGYTFLDEWRDAAGNIHQVEPGKGNYTITTEDLTLYAQWQCNHTIGGVEFRDNGDGTHDGYCGECGEPLGNYVERPHAYDESTGFCECGVENILPTGTITIKNNDWDRFWNWLSFGIFCEDYAEVSVTADGTGSDVVKVEYLFYSSALNEGNMPSDGWTEVVESSGVYKFSIQPQNKGAVYVRITDAGGNVSVINSEGIVVYEDREAVITEINYTYLENSNKDITVTLNGNTVKSMACLGEELTADVHYTVSDGTITLNANYLDMLTVGSYTFTVSYNPMGMENSGVTDLTTTFTVTVDMASIVGADVKVNVAYTYTGSACTPEPVVTLDGRTLIKDSDYTVSYSNNVNAGTATVIVTGKNNCKDSASTTFTIQQKEIEYEWIKATYLSYTGQLVLPEAIAKGLADGDSCEVIVSLVDTGEGAGINPGKWTARITGLSNPNYKLLENSSVPLEIAYTIYARQTAPVASGVSETVKVFRRKLIESMMQSQLLRMLKMYLEVFLVFLNQWNLMTKLQQRRYWLLKKTMTPSQITKSRWWMKLPRKN